MLVQTRYIKDENGNPKMYSINLVQLDSYFCGTLNKEIANYYNVLQLQNAEDFVYIMHNISSKLHIYKPQSFIIKQCKCRDIS